MKNWRLDIGWRRCVTVAAVLSFLLVWSLAGSDQSGIESGDSANFPDAGQDYAEVFSAGSNGIVYINWQEPQATNDFSREPWFLGAYRFLNDGSLVAEISRGGSSGLTNNLRYALHYYATGTGAALSINLLDTNSVVLAESEDLLTSSNVDHYVIVTADSGILTTNTVLLVNVPTAEYPAAAVIQIVGRHSMAATNESGLLLVHEALLYIDEDADGWTATDEIRNETSDYIFDVSGGIISNYSDWVNGNNGGSSTNNPGGGASPPDGDGDQGGGNNGGIIYINQAIGNDSFTGYAPTVAGRNGPKKTIHQGLAAVEQDGAHTLIINSGAYNENLDIRSNVKVFIEGKVRL